MIEMEKVLSKFRTTLENQTKTLLTEMRNISENQTRILSLLESQGKAKVE